YEMAAALYRRADRPRAESVCQYTLGSLARIRGDYAEARARFDESLSLARGKNTFLEAMCLKSLSDVAIQQAALDSAQAWCEEALGLVRELGKAEEEAACLEQLGELARDRSEHSTAEPFYQQSIALYHALGKDQSEARCISWLGLLAMVARSDYAAAISRLTE